MWILNTFILRMAAIAPDMINAHYKWASVRTLGYETPCRCRQWQEMDITEPTEGDR